MEDLRSYTRNGPNKGAGGMKLASDFKLPVSCFSSNHVNFSSIRVGMCLSGSSMEKIDKKNNFSSHFGNLVAKYGLI